MAPTHPWVIERMVQTIPRSRSEGRPVALWLIAGIILLCLLSTCLSVVLWSNGAFNALAPSEAGAPSATPVRARVVLTPTLAPTQTLPPPTLPPAPSPTATRTPSAVPLGPPAPTATLPPVPTPTPFTYRVKSGDSLISIAARYKVTIQDLKQANGLTSDLIRVGDDLIIPRPTPTPGH